MQDKTIKRIIIILAIATIVNIAAIFSIQFIIADSMRGSQSFVLGTAFKEPAQSNVIDIDLIRPPRTVINPGETVIQTPTITNTSSYQSFFRFSYAVYVEDDLGNVINDCIDEVKITINDGWNYKDGYWYYTKLIMPGETLACPIAAITYSEFFIDHLDYKVYIPVIIDCVDSQGMELDEINYWPNSKIDDVDYKRLNESASWTTTTNFMLF